MTLGEGILWSTILILLALSVYQISIRKKWGLVGKGFGGLILVGGLITVGIWGWLEYQKRPQKLIELDGIELGMSFVDVTLKKGMPNNEAYKPAWQEKDQYFYTVLFYGSDEYSSSKKTVTFIYGDTLDSVTVQRVCLVNGNTKISAVGIGSSEDALFKKFGEPISTEIDEDGLGKRVYYPQWNLLVRLEQARVAGYCAYDPYSKWMTY